MAIMYKGRCPCPHRLEYGDHADKKQCTKGGGILVKDWNREVVVKGLITHLAESPYHKFEREEAEDVVDHVIIEEESWPQNDYDDYMNKYGEQRHDGDASKRLRPTSPPRRRPTRAATNAHAVEAPLLAAVLAQLKRAIHNARAFRDYPPPPPPRGATPPRACPPPPSLPLPR